MVRYLSQGTSRPTPEQGRRPHRERSFQRRAGDRKRADSEASRIPKSLILVRALSRRETCTYVVQERGEKPLAVELPIPTQLRCVTALGRSPCWSGSALLSCAVHTAPNTVRYPSGALIVCTFAPGSPVLETPSPHPDSDNRVGTLGWEADLFDGGGRPLLPCEVFIPTELRCVTFGWGGTLAPPRTLRTNPDS